MFKQLKENMSTKKWFLIGSILFLFSGCSEDSYEIPTNENRLIIGAASPIQLDLEVTKIILGDYVLNPLQIDSITTDGPFLAEIDNSVLVLLGRPKKPLYNLTFWSQGIGESVLLKRTKKTLYSFVYNGKGREVKIKGSFNAWNPNSSKLAQAGNGFSTYELLSPGQYEYLYVVDGKEMLDPYNKDSISNGMGGWNSILTIQGPKRDKLPILKTESYWNSTISITSSNPFEKVYAYWGNQLIPSAKVNIQGNEVMIEVPSNAKDLDRSKLRLWAYNDEGASNEILVPLNRGKVIASASDLNRKDFESMIMYFLMVDRFNNGDASNDKALNISEVHPKADYFGGDLSGVTDKINDGYFEELGINTIWLSPITQNPEGPYGLYPEPLTKFSGYHGYWPISNVRVDYRFGTGTEFKELVDQAHVADFNVLLDYVANHVHEEHPIYQKNPDWATDLYLPDGTLNTQKWDEERLTTWFDTFMPTLDLSRMDVVGPMTDSALFWLEKYGIDGFRHDATKHIPEVFWRVLTRKVKEQIVTKTGNPVFQIGETYGSPQLIKSYVTTGMLDAQFDFNMYDQAVSAFAGQGSLQELANSLRESLKYYGDHNLMGYITGNQDRARFISYADGSLRFDEDAKHAGWNREISIQDTLAYQKLSALTAYMMMIPGVPCIYYGDEYGSPGGNDPDNRRQMLFEGLDKHQLATRERAKKLISLRRTNLALIYGDTEILEEDDYFLAISRSYFNNKVIAVFNTGDAAMDLKIPEGGNLNFYGTVTNGILTVPSSSFEIITYN